MREPRRVKAGSDNLVPYEEAFKGFESVWKLSGQDRVAELYIRLCQALIHGNMTRPTIELSMIVKNEEGTLARCLASVQGAVDRIVIGDTGSNDKTISIAESYGAEIISIAWNGNFAAARNAVLAESRCDWILVLDADEMLDAQGASQLLELVRRPEVAAYDVWRWNYVLQTNARSGEHGALRNPGRISQSMAFPAYVRSLNTRLFRRDPGIYFERPVHETVSFRLRTLGARVGEASFVIHHFGQAEDTGDVRTRKNILYHEIGLAYLKDHPNDARTCFELGLGELEQFKNPAAAYSYFCRALQINPKDGAALIFAGLCLVRLQRYSEAVALLLRARSIDPGSTVMHETLGDAYYHQAQYRQARAAYMAAMDAGSASTLVLAKSGLCDIYMSDRASGVATLQQSLTQDPVSPELLDVVALGFALAQEYALGAAVARRRLTMGGMSQYQYLVSCTLLRLSGDFEALATTAREGLDKYPHDPELLAELKSAEQVEEIAVK